MPVKPPSKAVKFFSISFKHYAKHETATVYSR